MQLFFFLSGFVCHRGDNILHDIWKKTKALLIPSVLLFSFCVWYYGQDVLSSLLYEFKSGYWFTYVLFFIFVVHYLCLAVVGKLSKTEADHRRMVYILLLLAVAAYIGHGHAYFFGEWLRCISFSFILKYYVFFLVGYLCSQHKKLFHNTLSRPVATNLLPLISTFTVLGLDAIPFGGGKIMSLAISLAQVFTVYRIFFNTDESSRIQSWLSFLGRHSLGIYFIHYYLLFGMPELHAFITNQATLYVFRGPGCQAILEFACLLPIAILLCHVSIYVRKFFVMMPVVSVWIFGKPVK